MAAEDQEGAWIEHWFWDGLNIAAKEALVSTDYKTVEEAQEILLCQKQKLADVEAGWHALMAQGTGSGVMHSSVMSPPQQKPPVIATHLKNSVPWFCRCCLNLLIIQMQWTSIVVDKVEDLSSVLDVGWKVI